MISVATALYNYLATFNIPVYGVNTVPDDATLPYMTFPYKEPYWNTPTSFYVTVYYRDRSSDFAALSKADEIVSDIKEGKVLDCTGGYVVLRPDSLPVQSLPPDGDIRGAYISLILNAFKTWEAIPEQVTQGEGAETPVTPENVEGDE